MKIKMTREEFISRCCRRIDELRKLALSPETFNKKSLEGIVTGLELALTEFLMWEEKEEK